MSYLRHNDSQIYSVILEKTMPEDRCFAVVVPVHASFIECKNVQIHTSEKATPLDLLAVKLARLLGKITRVELYFISGRAPELLDKELEMLRAQGYLEYILPFERETLQSNLEKLEQELDVRIIVREELEKLKSRKELKQYRITELGEKLTESGRKDSTEEGDLEFILLRDGNGWISVAHNVDSRKSRRYHPVGENDFAFFESFLKSYKHHLSETKIFRELTLASKVGVDQQEDSQLWLLWQKDDVFLRTGSSPFQINLKEPFPLPFDDDDFEEKIHDLDISNQAISTILPENAPPGVTFSVNLERSSDIESIVKKIEGKLSSEWWKDIIIEKGGIKGVIRLLFVATTPEAFERLILLRIHETSPLGALKTRNKWQNEITQHMNSLEKIGTTSGSIDRIMAEISSSADLLIAEEFVESDIRSKYREDILELEVLDKNNRILAYSILSEERFRAEYHKRRNERNFERMHLTARNNQFSQDYTLYLNTPNKVDYIGVLLAQRVRTRILRRSELEKELAMTVRPIPERFHVEALPKLEEIISSIRGPLEDDIRISEELVEKYIEESDFFDTLGDFNVIGTDVSIHAFCRLKSETIQSIYRNPANETPSRSIVVESSKTFKTKEGVPFQIIAVAANQANAKKITVLRLANQYENKLANLPTLKVSAQTILTEISRYSDLTPPILDDSSFAEVLHDARQFSRIYVEEEEIQRDIDKLFGGKNGYSGLCFSYSKEKDIQIEMSITVHGIDHASDEGTTILLQQKEHRKSGKPPSTINYRLFIVPLDHKAAVTLLTTRMRFLCADKLWKLKDLRTRTLKAAKSINKKVKRAEKVTGVTADEEVVMLVVDALRNQGGVILEDAILHHFGTICDIRLVEVDTEREPILKVEIDSENLEWLMNKWPETIFNPQELINSEVNGIAFSYRIQLLPKNPETLRLLLLERLWRVVEGNYVTIATTRDYMERIFDQYQPSAHQVDVDSLFADILSEMKERGFMTAEDYLLRQESERFGFNQRKMVVSSTKNQVTIITNVTRAELERIAGDPKIAHVVNKLESSGSFGKAPFNITYSTRFRLASNDTAHLWALLMTSEKIKGQITCQMELQKIYKDFLKEASAISETRFEPLGIDLIEEFKARLGNEFLLKESLIQKAAIDFIGGYSNINTTVDSAAALISKKEFKEFIKRCKRPITPTNDLHVEGVGTIQFKLRPMDEKALLGIIVICLQRFREETEVFLLKKGEEFFDELLLEAQIEEKKKNKLIGKRSKLLLGVLKEVQKLG